MSASYVGSVRLFIRPLVFDVSNLIFYPANKLSTSSQMAATSGAARVTDNLAACISFYEVWVYEVIELLLAGGRRLSIIPTNYARPRFHTA